MELKFTKSISTVRPEEIDETSSSTTTYIRKNIQEVVHNTNMNEDEEPVNVTYFEYDEAKLTKEEYQRYLQDQKSEQLRADVDFVMLMGGMV